MNDGLIRDLSIIGAVTLIILTALVTRCENRDNKRWTELYKKEAAQSHSAPGK